MDATGLGLESLCTIPSGASHFGSRRAFVTLVPGVETLDLFSTSVWREVWKDGSAVECYVPKALIGWEFFSLLYPHPDCAAALRLNGTIELLIGRPPGAPSCPSILFAFVPAGYAYSGSSPVSAAASSEATAAMRRSSPSRAPAPARGVGRTAQTVERQQGNLDFGGRATHARLVVLCPTSVFKDSTSVPADVAWGLYVSPRSRTMILVNRDRGRIDLQLACMLTHDAVFRRCGALSAAFGRLFEPLGTAHVVPHCFQGVDPLDIHCGITNALVVDHLDIELDGREDYRLQFGVRLPEFFLSNSSVNLCFLVPVEAQRHRAGARGMDLSPIRCRGIPDMPVWSLSGDFDEEGERALRQYRERSQQQPEPEFTSVKNSLLEIFGLDGSMTWLTGLAGCSDITVAPKALPTAQPTLPPPAPHPPEPEPDGAPKGMAQANTDDGRGAFVFSSPYDLPTDASFSGSVDGGSGGAGDPAVPLKGNSLEHQSTCAKDITKTATGGKRGGVLARRSPLDPMAMSQRTSLIVSRTRTLDDTKIPSGAP